MYIENADATPPHLNVFPAFGELRWCAWFFAILCVWVAQSYFLQEVLGPWCCSWVSPGTQNHDFEGLMAPFWAPGLHFGDPGMQRGIQWTH